jgi:pyruvate-formate lyase-activating enzyme
MKTLTSTGILKHFCLVVSVVIGLSMFSPLVQAGEADVIKATIKKNADGTYRIDATVRSRDRGWDYYADRIEAVTRDGKILGTRILVHPHDDEQPFTRELDQLKIPPGVKEIVVRASMKNAKSGEQNRDQTVTLAIP